MGKALSTFLLVFTALFFISSHAKTETKSLDQIVAIINDDVITRSELDLALVKIKTQIKQDPTAAAALSGNALQKQVLDQLINKKLQLQIAHQLGIEVSNAELNKVVESVARQNHTTVNDLYQRLGHENFSVQEYRHEIREQIALQKLQQQEVAGKVNITPDEITNFMHSQIWQTDGAKEYRLEDILIPLSDTPSSEEIKTAKKHALDVLTKLHAGQSFHAIAEMESADKHALQGGDLGWRKLPEIPSAFTDHVLHMHVNEIGGPIQTPNGFHVIRLADMRMIKGSTPTAPNRKQVEELLLQQKFEEAVQNWISKLRGQAYIVLNPDHATL